MTARLVPLSEGSVAVVLDKAITLIGRHPDCDAVLDENQKISRRHCCIAQVDNRLVLRDLGSMNGVRVNGEPIVEVDLSEGDEITIGDEEFVLELKADKPGSNRRPVASDPPTPEKPRRTPKPLAAPTPAIRRAPLPLPEELSMEFPVPIAEEDELVEEDLRPRRLERAAQKTPDPDEQVDDKPPVFKFDSGEFELSNFRDV